MAQSLRSQSGFSLLEVMFVLLIGGILSAIAIVNLQTANQGYRLTTAGFVIAGKVSEARTNALKRNRPTWVLVDSVARSVTVQTAGPSGTTNIGGSEFLPGGVIFNTAGPTTLLTFDSMGRPLNPPQTIQLRYAGTGLTRTVTVTSTGRVRVN